MALLVHARKSIPGYKWLAFTMLDVSVWTIISLFVAFVPDLALKNALVTINCIFIWSSPLFFYLFVCEFIRKKQFINVFTVLFLVLIPISIQVILLIPEIRPLFYTTKGMHPEKSLPIYQVGWIFWMYCRLLFTLSKSH